MAIYKEIQKADGSGSTSFYRLSSASDTVTLTEDTNFDYSYNDLTNKPSINGVTLSGNKSTSDLGITIPSKTSELTNDSNYVNKSVSDLVNYYNITSINSLITTLNSSLDSKVDKINGKELSTNDFDDEMEYKLTNLPIMIFTEKDLISPNTGITLSQIAKEYEISKGEKEFIYLYKVKINQTDNDYNFTLDSGLYAFLVGTDSEKNNSFHFYRIDNKGGN